MTTDERTLTTGALAGAAIRDLFRPPFVTLFALDLLASLASLSVAVDDDTGFVAGLVLLAVSLYITIAVILAAGTGRPETSADAWIRAAIRRRAFFRLLLASLFSIVLILLGSIALLIGGVVVAGYVGLAQAAAVLERKGPGDAIRRSAELTGPARTPVAIIAAASILVPSVVIQAGVELDWDEALGATWYAIVVLSRTASLVGDIALTRAFVALGGEPTPPMSEMSPAREERV